MSDLSELVWNEKYRPSTLEECILPEATKKMMAEFIESGTMPHLLLSGGAGQGKTSLSRVLAKELNADLMFINASLESGIDTIRTKVIQFSSSVSFSGGMKIILLDEADFLSNGAQASLRGVIEEFGNVRFIFTCNHKNRIIEAIHSRTSVIDFKCSNEERPKLSSKFFRRVVGILKKESIEFDVPVVVELVNKHFPDFRKVLSELQKYASSGKIDSGILLNQSKETFKDLFKSMKEKNFTEVRKWTATNADVEPQVLFRDLYDNAYSLMEMPSVPRLVVLLADYGDKATRSSDPEILITAALTEIMVGVTWK